MYRVYYKLHRKVRNVVALGELDLELIIACILSQGGKVEGVKPLIN